MTTKPVCIVSTYPPQRCGIGTYTAELAGAIGGRGVPVTVLSERGAAAGTVSHVTSWPVWDRRENWVSRIVEAARTIKAGVVHVQHTPDTLGWDDRMPGLLAALARLGIITVVTLHTVHTPGSGLLEGRRSVPFYHRRLASLAGAIVVHGTATQADELRRQGVAAEKIHVIPHGTKIFRLPEPAESRTRLGLSNTGPVLLYFGFIHALKNIHTIIRAMRYLYPRVPDIHLLMAGSVQNRGWYNLLYLWHCRRRVNQLKRMGGVELREEFVPDHLIPVLYGAAEIILLPHAQRYGSASGILHNALGAGKLILCSQSPKFAEVAEHISPDLQAATHDPKAWAKQIGHLLYRPDREKLLNKIVAYAEETAWPGIAARHLELYEKLKSADRRGGAMLG